MILNFENWVESAKVPKFDFQNWFSVSEVIEIFLIFFSFFFSLKNINIRLNFSFWKFWQYQFLNHFSKTMPNFWHLNSQNSIISFGHVDFRQKSFQICIHFLKTWQPVSPYCSKQGLARIGCCPLSLAMSLFRKPEKCLAIDETFHPFLSHCAVQRFVSSTRKIEVLLSHTFSPQKVYIEYVFIVEFFVH